MLRSSQFFGRLRFHKSEVPELTLAPTKIGLPPAPGIKGGFGSIHNIFLILSYQKVNYPASLLWITFTIKNCSYVTFCHNNKAFLFAWQKRCSRSHLKKRRRRLSALANKKIGSTASSTLKVAAPGGSSSSTLYKNYYYYLFPPEVFFIFQHANYIRYGLSNYLIT